MREQRIRAAVDYKLEGNGPKDQHATELKGLKEHARHFSNHAPSSIQFCRMLRRIPDILLDIPVSKGCRERNTRVILPVVATFIPDILL